METHYTIGRLAKAASVPVSTLRYYEQRGLMRPEKRTKSSYRIYSAESLFRVRFIRRAQESGFTLEDIRQLLDFRDGTGDPCGGVRDLVSGRLERVEKELHKLHRVRRVLRETLTWCESPHAQGSCPALERLHVAASERPTAEGSR